MSKPAVDQATYYRGIPTVRYDLVKEFFIALVVSGVIVLLLAVALSSPDVPPVTIQSWAQADPVDFVTTAAAELAGTSDSAVYGPPYTDGTDGVQSLGFFAPQQWLGNSVHLNPPQDFVLAPLAYASVGNSALTTALAQYNTADSTTQQAWLSAYTDALANATVQDGQVTVAAGDYGPVPVLMSNELAVANSGGLDGLLLVNGQFFATNYTKPLLFMGDGSYLSGLASDQHLSGDQWGAMNETGLYPGQTWLWLFTTWYQIPFFADSAASDLAIVLVMGFLTLLLVLVPYIPILRDIPRWVPVHRLIWRDYYRWRRTRSSPRA